MNTITKPTRNPRDLFGLVRAKKEKEEKQKKETFKNAVAPQNNTYSKGNLKNMNKAGNYNYLQNDFDGESLRVGSKGRKVSELQRKLGITQDGVFGNQTKNALMNFQRRNNLAVDGVMGNNTFDRLTDKNSDFTKAIKQMNKTGGIDVSNTSTNAKPVFNQQDDKNYNSKIQEYNNNLEQLQNVLQNAKAGEISEESMRQAQNLLLTGQSMANGGNIPNHQNNTENRQKTGNFSNQTGVNAQQNVNNSENPLNQQNQRLSLQQYNSLTEEQRLIYDRNIAREETEKATRNVTENFDKKAGADYGQAYDDAVANLRELNTVNAKMSTSTDDIMNSPQKRKEMLLLQQQKQFEVQNINQIVDMQLKKDMFVYQTKQKQLEMVEQNYSNFITGKQKIALERQKIINDFEMKKMSQNSEYKKTLISGILENGGSLEGVNNMTIEQLEMVQARAVAQKQYETSNKEETEVMAQTLVDRNKVNEIADIVSYIGTDKFKDNVGSNFLGRWDVSQTFGVTGNDFNTKVQNYFDKNTLDFYANVKSEGVTFGALSEKELQLLKNAAKRIRVMDDGSIDGSEEDVKEYLLKVQQYEQSKYLQKHAPDVLLAYPNATPSEASVLYKTVAKAQDTIMQERARQRRENGEAVRVFNNKYGDLYHNSTKSNELNSAMQAIASVESGGSYQARGPIVTSGMYKGERAMGKYQVMPRNLPQWSKEALGQEISVNQFMSNPQLQDKIVAHQFEKNYQKYGNWDDVASVWFTGQPKSKGANKKDVLGTSGADYVRRFNNAYRNLA